MDYIYIYIYKHQDKILILNAVKLQIIFKKIK